MLSEGGVTINFIQSKAEHSIEVTELLTDIGTQLAKHYLLEKIKDIPSLRTKWGNVRVIFQLIAKLYDPIPYDLGNTELLNVLKTNETRDGQLNLNDVVYSYNVDWEFSEDFQPFSDSWMQDIYIVDENGERQSLIHEQEIAANRVMGFRVNMYSHNAGMDLQKLLVIGYDAIDSLKTTIVRNSRLKIQTALITMSIISSKDTNLQLYNKLSKKIKHNEILSRIILHETTEEFSQLIIYSKDKFDVTQIVDAINARWPF